jgi:hypothetical protein
MRTENSFPDLVLSVWEKQMPEEIGIADRSLVSYSNRFG